MPVAVSSAFQSFKLPAKIGVRETETESERTKVWLVVWLSVRSVRYTTVQSFGRRALWECPLLPVFLSLWRK